METNDHAHFNLEHFCAPVIHPSTGKLITKYAELANNPKMAEVWSTAFGKEFGGLAQGDEKTGAKGTNSLIVMTHEQIKKGAVNRHMYVVTQMTLFGNNFRLT